MDTQSTRDARGAGSSMYAGIAGAITCPPSVAVVCRNFLGTILVHLLELVHVVNKFALFQNVIFEWKHRGTKLLY